MEISQGLFFTVAVSLFASFVLAKILSFVSACEAEYKTFSAKMKAAACESRDRKGSSVRVFDDEKRVRFIEEAVVVDECEEEQVIVEEVVVFESPFVREMEDDNGEACRGVEVIDLEERQSVGGGDQVVEMVVDRTRETSTSDEAEVDADQVLDESPERSNCRELVENERNMGNQSDELMKINEKDCVGNNEVELVDEWEWEMEGFEKSELEKCFRAALAFVESKNNADRISVLDDDVKMELCWLHKVAIEGPNSEPQYTALKVFALAKWNAWRQVENMSPEVAMEHYIALLSKCIPNWMQNDTGDFKTTQISVQECDKIEVADPNLISKEKE